MLSAGDRCQFCKLVLACARAARDIPHGPTRQDKGQGTLRALRRLGRKNNNGNEQRTLGRDDERLLALRQHLRTAGQMGPRV
eukprot:12729837-Alexandrium_andersonii.AAC.1